VKLDDSVATSVQTVVGQNRLTAVVPAGTGTSTVTVGLAGGNRINVGSFTYGASPTPPPVPVVQSMSPASQRMTETVGTPATPSSPFVLSGFTRPVTYSIFPALPQGLTIDPTTGVVSGTPAAVYPSTSHWITAASIGNTESASSLFVLEVKEPEPLPTPSPQPLPEPVPAGGSMLTIDGTLAPVEVAPNGRDNGLVVSGDAWTMTLDGLGPDGRPLVLGPNGVLILEKGRDVRTTGTGFLANSQVDIYMDPPVLVQTSGAASGAVTAQASEAILVGTVQTDSAGSFAGTATLPDSIAVGEHVLQAVGFSPSRQMRALSLGVIVKPWITLDQGTRTRNKSFDRIRTSGESAGLEPGVRLTPHIRFQGESGFKKGKATITVQADGTYRWTRKINKSKALTAYVSYKDTESNRVRWARIR
jgi:hypothetical protein